MNYYENHEFVSTSLLKEVLKSPAKAKHWLNNQKETDALILGRCFHEIMEGIKTFIVFNPDNRPEPTKTFGSNKNKEWKAELLSQDKDVISLDEFNMLNKAAQNIKESGFFKRLQGTEFAGAEKEYYTTFPNGDKAKCKPDAMYLNSQGDIIIVDWKTTAEILTPNKWNAERIIKKYGYHYQAVHYSEIVALETGKKVHFFFMFAEKAAPNECLPVYIDPDGELYNDTFVKWQEVLSITNECFKNDNWPSLEDSIKNNLITI